MVQLAKDEGHKLICTFLEATRCKTDALDKKLLANCWYEPVSRRAGKTLLDFFATRNMAFADAIKPGVTIDDERRAYHMLIRSGLTDDHISPVNVSVGRQEKARTGQLP